MSEEGDMDGQRTDVSDMHNNVHNPRTLTVSADFTHDPFCMQPSAPEGLRCQLTTYKLIQTMTVLRRLEEFR